MKGNHIYRLVDDKGRVLIPKHYREATEIHTGDIVKLRLTDTGLSVEKVQLIEMGDQSPAAMAAYVKAAIAYLPRQKRMELAAALIGQEIISGGSTENVS